MRIQSAPLAFIDQTDSRKLEVYIKSNLPTVQIYNSNSGVYTPNWTENGGLTLEADVFLDSRELEEDYSETYSTTWYREDTTLSTNTDTLNITDNVLADTPIITYIFEATYQGITASSRITFARVDTGLNGNDGADGTSVRILGTADSVAQIPDTNYYTIVYSEGAIVAAELGDSYIYQGDLYVCSVLDGDEEGNDYFVNVGDIQGPKGDDAKVLALSGNSQTFKISGESITPSTITVAAQTFNTTATNWSYSMDGGITFDSNAPDGVVRDGDIVTITGETLSGNTLVIRVSDGPIGSDGTIYDVFTVYKVSDGDKGETGDSAPIVFLSNEHISFVADENGLTYGGVQDFFVNVVAYSGTTKVLPEIDLALAEVSLFDGMSIAIDEDTMDAIKEYNPDFEEIILKVSVSDGFNLGSALSNNGTIPITVTSPATVSLQLNWSKINAGASGVGISSTTVTYGVSDSSSTQPTDWQSNIPTVDEGRYLWTRTVIDYTEASMEDTITYTYVKQGSKGDTGSAGSSVTISSIQYQEGSSATTAPTGTWSNAVVAVDEGKYLWTKTTFSDENVSYGVAKQGSSGKGISSITEYYLATTVSSGVTTDTDGWTTDVQNITSTNKYLWNYEVVTYTDSTTSSTTPMMIGVFGDTGEAGKSIQSVTEYYLATALSSGITTDTPDWTTAVQMLTATNKYLWNYELITYTDNTTSTIAPVIIGVYGDKGDTGIGINSVTVTYGSSGSASTQPTSWQSDVPIVAEGSYLWTRTVTDYTDDTIDDTITLTYAKQGVKGDTGSAGSSVTVSSIQYQASTSATTAPTGTWSDSIVSVAGGNYLWTKTTFSDGNIAYGVARQGSDGAKGDKGDQGIQGIQGPKGDQGIQGPKGNDGQTSYFHIKYSTNANGNPMTETPSTYIGTYVDYTADDSTDYTKYTWSRFVGSQGVKGDQGIAGTNGEDGLTSYLHIAYATSSNGATGFSTTDSVNKTYIGQYTDYVQADSTDYTKYKWTLIKGDKGDKGDAGADAYTVLLTNESHVFAGNVSNATASSATTQVLAYKGTTAQTVTITSVNGVAAATTSTATGITGLSFSCSALSGTSPTITFTCTTAFVSPSGTIPIVLSVGGVSVTKMFTYSIAFKGTTGTASSSYWLVSNASVVQKTSSGDILCTPATLTFTGRIQTGSSAPTNYACRWIIATSTDGSTYTDTYTSTANEATVSLTASATYKAVRARMYLAGGTTTLLDEQIIPFVSDGETGAIGSPGDPGVTFQVYSNNGYALSTSIPTILLQTFAYLGDVEITAGATFQWYRHNGTDWDAVSGATNAYFNVSRNDVSFSNNYMCKMQFNSTEYVGVVTIEDKNDENKVFASKPSNYFAGDLWIVGTDYVPNGYTVGTMLRAEHTNTAYADSDWTLATKYDDEITELKTTVDSYKQYFSVNSTNGFQIGNSSINNDIITTNQVEATIINADTASIETLDITGRYSGSTMLQAPVINLGNFSIVVESNGSLSIVVNT